MRSNSVRILVSLAIIIAAFVILDPVEPCLGQSSGGDEGRVKSRNRNAPTRENRSAIGLGTKYLNGVVGGLRNGPGATFGIEATTADTIPGVEFRATALVSTKLYRRLELEAYVPAIGDDRTHADLWFSYTRRPKDNFFAIGTQVPNLSGILVPKIETNFDLEQRSYNATLYRDFTDRLQAGLYARAANSSSYRGQDDEDVPIDLFFSGDPNVVQTARWLPGLEMNTEILSYGAFVEFDGRDNSRGLTRGGYVYARVGSADSLEVEDTFSDYGWTEAEIDLRTYVPLGGDKTSLAIRGFTTLKDPKGGSQIPFYDLSFLGGRSFVRGFETYRIRGNNLLAFSTELRRTLLTQKEDRGFDVFVFGDTGQVWGDSRSQTNPVILANDDFDSSKWKAGFGGGFQYRFSKSFAGRIEVGSSNESTRVYFSVSRGF